MKYKFILLIIFLPVLAFGQKINKDSLAENLIGDLKDSWNLGISEDINQPLNIRVYNKFKSLFDATATIDDEFNVVYKYDSDLRKSVYQLGEINLFDVYAHNAGLQISALSIDTTIGKTKLLSKNENEYVYQIPRKVTVYKKRNYVLEEPSTYFNREIENRKIKLTKDSINEKKQILENRLYNTSDTSAIYEFESNANLKITIKFINDVPKITQIQKLDNASIKYLNDNDSDAVLNKEDHCKNKPGDFTTNGCPDADFDGVPDEIDACPHIYGSPDNNGCPYAFFNNKMEASVYVGFQFNNVKMNLPELNNLGYKDESGNDAMDILQSQKGDIDNPGIIISLMVAGDFSYYFGKKAKQFGLSIGVSGTSFNASYQIIDPVLYTFKANDGINDYRRRVTIRTGSKAEIQYQVINIPLLFKYRLKLNGGHSDWSFQFGLGPSVMLFRNSNDNNLNIDIEGLYQTDATGIIYENMYNINSSWNLYLTGDSINSQNASPGANAVFDSLNKKGFDFVYNENYNDKSKKLNRNTIAINFRFDGVYKIPNNSLSVKFGVHFVYAPLIEDKSKSYVPIDKAKNADGSNANYNSFYNAKSKGYYSAYGINAGIIYGF